MKKSNEPSQPPPSTTTGQNSQPAKATGLLSWNEDEQPLQDDSTATISFAYWRGNYPGNKKQTPSTRPGLNHLLDYMRAHNIPLTRENYLAINWPEGAPDPMPAELEAEIPPEFRLFWPLLAA
jgi:hypothetical protein